MTTEQKTKPVTDLFEQAMKSYEQALKTGVKMQEESAKVFSDLVTQATSPQDWQKQMKSVTDDFIPQTQKTVDEGLKLIEQTSKSSVELLKKAVAVGQPTSAPDAQAKMLGLWEASLERHAGHRGVRDPGQQQGHRILDRLCQEDSRTGRRQSQSLRNII